MELLHKRGWVIVPAVLSRAGNQTRARQRADDAIAACGIRCTMEPHEHLRMVAWCGPCPTQVAGGEGRWRYEVQDAHARTALAHMFEETLAHNGLLGLRSALAHAANIYALRTLNATTPPTQARHTDYDPALVMHMADGPHVVPLSAIWAPIGGFQLVVGPKHAPIEKCTKVHVPAGHIVVFRGDLCHGGGEHMSAYMRFHAYLAMRGVHIADAVFDCVE